MCLDGGPYVIAEAGVNHNGDEAAALSMVDAAALAGADAVKFQMFTTGELVTAAAPAAEYQTRLTDHASQRNMLESLELSDTSFGRIANRCTERGVAFIATPFTVPDLNRLMTLGTAAIKIASTDIVDLVLLDAACGANRPIILSTGAADEAEIAAAVARVDAGGARDRLVLLHCVSAYPTPISDANLAAIWTLGKRFSTRVGFSDHTTSTLTGAFAVAAGARVLEKHFTLDASAVGPDHAVSLEPAALAEYVRLTRCAYDALGDGRLGVQQIEAEVRRVARKTVVAACDIPVDALLSRENLTTKRAGAGLAPVQMERLIGLHATVSIEAETPISWAMVQ